MKEGHVYLGFITHSLHQDGSHGNCHDTIKYLIWVITVEVASTPNGCQVHEPDCRCCRVHLYGLWPLLLNISPSSEDPTHTTRRQIPPMPQLWHRLCRTGSSKQKPQQTSSEGKRLALNTQVCNLRPIYITPQPGRSKES